LLECLKCQKRRGIYHNGEPYVSTPDYCPKCKKEIAISFKYEGRFSIWEKNCAACGYSEKDVEDKVEKENQRLAQELRDKELLQQYRSEYCLSAQEGMEYVLQANSLERFSESIRKDEEKKADPDYPKVVQLKRLGVVDLEQLLSKELKKHKYIKLSFKGPDIDKYVIVPFTVRDADASRKEYDSEAKLRKIIKKVLEGTNWRLMHEGVKYRLGYLSGRLKGFEKEEDLLEVVKSDK